MLTTGPTKVGSHELTPIDVALQKLLLNLPAITGQEDIALLETNGRILAVDYQSAIDVPPHDNSAMDGYAVRSADLSQDHTRLKVSQRIAAGEIGEQLSTGEAARIFTGAPMPPGADAVVMQENCEVSGSDVIVLKAVVSGENLRRAGEDVRSGAVLFKAGHRLRAQDIGLIASTGSTRLAVQRRLKIALMTTGNELVRPGTDLKPGQIYNSNFFTLAALLQGLPVDVIDLGVVGDDLSSTRQALAVAARSADCIISTGGVSVGEEDYVKAAVEAEGELELWKLAIKPGKPLACGKVRGDQGQICQFFGLPGNPVSAFVTFVLVVRPCLLAMLGCATTAPKKIRLRAGFERPLSGLRQEYLRSVIDIDGDGDARLLPYSNQSSGVGASLSEADGLAIIPPHTAIARDDFLEYMAFSELLN